jgi:hypothetical protein
MDRSTIATVAGASSVFAADIDGDGDLDVVSTSPDDDSVIWHENNGAAPPGFGFSPITFFTTDGVQSVVAADVDGDGDMDVLSASADDNKTAWYENTAGDGTSWDDHVISTATTGAVSVCVSDLDNDGDVDVLSASTSKRLDHALHQRRNPRQRRLVGRQCYHVRRFCHFRLRRRS